MINSTELKCFLALILAINVTFITKKAFSIECKNILQSLSSDWNHPTADKIIGSTKQPWKKHPRNMNNENPNQWHVISHTLNFAGLGSAKIEVLIIKNYVQVRINKLKLEESRWANLANALPFRNNEDKLIKRVERRVERSARRLRRYYKNLHPNFNYFRSDNVDLQNAGRIGIEFMAGFNTSTNRGMDSLIHFISLLQGYKRDVEEPSISDWFLLSRGNWHDDVIYPAISSPDDGERAYGAIYTNVIEDSFPLGLDGQVKNFLRDNSSGVRISNRHDQIDKVFIEVEVIIEDTMRTINFEVTREGILIPRINQLSINPLYGILLDRADTNVAYIKIPTSSGSWDDQLLIRRENITGFIEFLKTLNTRG